MKAKKTSINWPETRSRFFNTGRTIARVARIEGFHPATFSYLLLEKLHYDRGEKYDRMVNYLREIGCLVEEDVKEEKESCQ